MADQIAILLQQTAEKAKIEQELEVAKAIQETLVPSDAPVDEGDADVRRLLPAGRADRRRLVDVGRARRRQDPARDRRRHRPRRAVGDDHRGREGGVRRRALRPQRRRHGDAPARDHEPRDLRERAAPVRDDVLRVDRRHQGAHDHVRERRPQLPVPVPRRRGQGRVRLADDPRQPARRRPQLEVRGEDDRARRRATSLVWYTDGIVECENEAGEEYGEKRFRASVAQAPPRSTPARCATRSSPTPTAYFGETPRKDDITMVVGRIH